MDNKILFADAKKEKKTSKSKFPQSIQRPSIFTHSIPNSRWSARNYTYYKTLAAFEQKMSAERAKILAIGASFKLQIYMSKDSFNYIIFGKIIL